jgi:urease accessory protein
VSRLRSWLWRSGTFYFNDMLIQEKIGRIGSFAIEGRMIDALRLEWYETGKRVMRKQTSGRREVALRFLNESPALMEGDVLYEDEEVVIVVEIVPCDVMVIPMGSLAAVAAICYEIGNRHLPLFIEEGVLLAPFEEPLYRWLGASGFEVSKEERKLLYPLRSTVAGHEYAGSGAGSGSLFSRILQITNPR